MYTFTELLFIYFQIVFKIIPYMWWGCDGDEKLALFYML